MIRSVATKGSRRCWKRAVTRRRTRVESLGALLAESGSPFRPFSRSEKAKTRREPVRAAGKPRGSRGEAAGKPLHGEELGKGGTKWSDWCNRTLPPGCVWQGQDDIVIAPSFILRARFPVPRCLPQRFSKPRIEASPFSSAAELKCILDKLRGFEINACVLRRKGRVLLSPFVSPFCNSRPLISRYLSR